MDTIEIVVACNEAYTVRTWGAAVLRPYKSAAKQRARIVPECPPPCSLVGQLFPFSVIGAIFNEAPTVITN
jgi:hypothetical protein